MTNQDFKPRAHHDLGGVPRYACEPIPTEPHALSDFDREVDAIRQILGAKGVMSVDELRRGIEAIPEAEYTASATTSAGYAASRTTCSPAASSPRPSCSLRWIGRHKRTTRAQRGRKGTK